MANLVAKLLLLMSVLLMPLAMSPATASGATDHQAMSHEAMEHCPDPLPAGDSEPGIAPCTMACAAALPAICPAAAALQVEATTPLSAMPMKALVGVLLEIATPPPRTA